MFALAAAQNSIPTVSGVQIALQSRFYTICISASTIQGKEHLDNSDPCNKQSDNIVLLLFVLFHIFLWQPSI